MTAALRDLLARHVDAGTMPGAVAVVGTPTGDELVTAGAASVGGPPIEADAIFRIQSMTKPATAVAALRLAAAGRIALDDPVERWLPELADRRVLTSPDAPLTDTTPSRQPITLRHLLTNSSGYGMLATDSPLRRAMLENGTEAGFDPSGLGADEWLARVASLPLAFAPGEGWRYHLSSGILGVLVSRVTGRSAHDWLCSDVFAPLGMVDTGYWVPLAEAHRLPAAYRRTDAGFVETEPAGGGFYAGEPDHDVSHEELVSTARDYARFARMLATGGRADGAEFVPRELFELMTSDQTPQRLKTPDSFAPGFWDGMGWGFGVGVQTTGPHAGRFGWSGGLGTDFYVDPGDGFAILLTQVQMDARVMQLVAEFQEIACEVGPDGLEPPTSSV